MTINKHNYEAYLLDFIEGRLDDLSVLMLKDFLQSQPELGSWDELVADLPFLQAEPIAYAGREALKKETVVPVGNTNESNYNYVFIAYHEGLLTPGAKAETHAFLQANPFLKADFESYAKARLQPDTAIVFAGKSKLKRKVILWGPKTYSALAAAASLLLLVTVSWWGMRTSPDIQRIETAAAVLPTLQPKATPGLPQVEATLLYRATLQATNEISILPAIRESVEIPPTLAMKQAVKIPVASRQADQKLHFVPDTYLYDIEVFYAALGENSEKDDRTAIGTLLAGTSKAVKNIFNRQIAEPINELAPEAGISLWDIASLGVRTYNTLTDRDVELTAAHGPEGDVVAYRLRSERIQITRKINE